MGCVVSSANYPRTKSHYQTSQKFRRNRLHFANLTVIKTGAPKSSGNIHVTENEGWITIKEYIRRIKVKRWRIIKNIDLKCKDQTRDPELLGLGKDMGKCLPMLRKLKLTYNYFHSHCMPEQQHLSDKGITDFTWEIGKNLKHLQQLELIILGSFYITDKALKGVAKNIGRNFKRLTHLKLHFPEGRNISQRGAIYLGKKLKRNLSLNKINRLSFDFSEIKSSQIISFMTKEELNRMFERLGMVVCE